MHDLEYYSAHAQMAWRQRFRKSEISPDTGKENNYRHERNVLITTAELVQS